MPNLQEWVGFDTPNHVKQNTREVVQIVDEGHEEQNTRDVHIVDKGPLERALRGSLAVLF